MAIFGIGIDSIDISRFTSPNLEGIARRILTNAEFEEYNKANKKEIFIAKKFATKEAVSKALGTGIGAKLSFQDIEISHTTQGKPICTISAKILANITNNHSSVVHISITDTSSLVCAYAVATVGEFVFQATKTS